MQGVVGVLIGSGLLGIGSVASEAFPADMAVPPASPSQMQDMLLAQVLHDEADAKVQALSKEEFEECYGRLLDAVAMATPQQPVIHVYNPDRGPLWRQWKGTALQTTMPACFLITAVNILVCTVLSLTGNMARGRESLGNVVRLWHMHMTLSTFVVSFFLNQAKEMWSFCYTSSRKIQGRLNDVSLIGAMHAARDERGFMTREAQCCCDTVARYIRIFTILFYSNTSRRYWVLQSSRGLKGLHRRGILEENEMRILLSIPSKSRYHAIYSWIQSAYQKGLDEGSLIESSNTAFMVLMAIRDLRGTCASVPDALDGRCPVAYVHLVQILVDTFLVVTPFAAIADMGWYSIAASFLLTLFFGGLLNLSKMLMEPFDDSWTHSIVDARPGVDPIQIETLIQEQNAASRRFQSCSFVLPCQARTQRSRDVPVTREAFPRADDPFTPMDGTREDELTDSSSGEDAGHEHAAAEP